MIFFNQRIKHICQQKWNNQRMQYLKKLIFSFFRATEVVGLIL